ncbi:MAG TPA: isoleucine--tRNA ligase, partial [Clostridiales bacterium]|nr:isoleucine--tRNA ligase [Clostridiales bacterium]
MANGKPDFASTLNLPTTEFPMRANLPQREVEFLKKWQNVHLYETLLAKNAGKPTYILHDGPPYANGDMHMGHALNRCLKDFILKYKTMSGYMVPFIPGWDTHGLPIELQMIKKHKVYPKDMNPVAFRTLCEDFARNCVNTQKEQIKRLGCLADFDHPYLTLQYDFEAKQIEVFGTMAEKGYIYKGMKPVYWCAHDETALAEAEIEYADDPCVSIYVKFPVKDDRGLFTPYTGSLDSVYFVIWTTTTWTLPGNMAICLGPAFTYSLLKCGDEVIVVAESLAESVLAAAKFEGECTLLATFTGAELEGIICQHPFMDKESHLILGDHVTLESGTGCVHTAPGHGVEDFVVCQNYPFLKENIVVPVDEHGKMNELAGEFAGLTTDEANVAILQALIDRNVLWAQEKIVHQYPHCWRCKHPILFRATQQWFCSVEGFKDEAVNAIHHVRWIPAWGESRIESMVKDRADWCISRQRTWGVPIPIFYCADCKKTIISKKAIDRIAVLFEKEGSNAWYKYSPREMIGDLAVCDACGSTDLEKETDIMDVWFDSGSSYASVLKRENHSFPADLYLEGNDQYRGWFQSSLLTSVATRGVAPYKIVITHGMVVDGEGKKMSKSLGNGIDPRDIINEYGADILRLWVSSSDYTGDVRLSKDILKQLSEIYRKIRNTLRILLANLGDPATDFVPATHMLPFHQLTNLDQWALTRLQQLIQRVRTCYDHYEFHTIYHDIHNFCATDLSKLYIDISKDRLYVERKDSQARRSGQTAMYQILHALTLLIAPLLSYTAEETWQFMPHLPEDDRDSVFYNQMPSFDAAFTNPKIEESYSRLFLFRDDVMKALEEARAQKVIGKSLEAKITIFGSADNQAMKEFAFFQNELNTIFITSGVKLSHDAP